jgi:DnaJ-class molecular chaperone
MSETDYYKLLGVETDAGEKTIREAYRQLAFQYHPDRNRGSQTAAEKMKQINEAYAVLSSSEKRRDYDALRNRYGDSAHTRFRKSYTDKDIFSGSDIHGIFEEMARSFGFRGSDEILKEFYGKGFQTFEFHRPGLFAGGFFFVGGPGKGRLPISKGPLSMLFGQVIKQLTGSMPPKNGADVTEAIVLNEDIARRGGPYAYFYKKQNKKLIVKIPANVRDGQKIRLAGMGAPGKGGGPRGDLFLKVQIRKPLMRRLKNLISHRR